MRKGQPLTGRVQPQAGGTGQDADAVIRPDRIPVAQAFGVVPHPVRIDEPRPGILHDFLHGPVHMPGYAGHHKIGRRTQPLGGPVFPHEGVVAPDPTGGHQHGLGIQGKVTHDDP
ncbi:hypothetical protein DGo_PA0114 (plasmid) [Deinococcus gobiensis I-0]|uniref:Uncharacterized protein n=1 Tax=Deinococcus gobiensis (strain DSM 21396 / JCM 16679 / CGMCC 1.7299 / I-0) TaxID=745776 RepID=H8H0Y1_DEIGI|nr:hypothetical protein DGo_PA0114 [Deinococcus gobiensis I-0]